MSTTKENHTDLSLYQHPQDARVIVAPNIDVFKQAAALNNGLVILKSTEEQKKRLREIFGAVTKLCYPEHRRYVSISINGAHNNLQYTDSPIGNSSTHDMNGKETPIIAAKNFLKQLSPVFHEITASDKSALSLFTNFDANDDEDGLHEHHTVMNFSIFDKGTVWPNEKGELLQADEGDVVYIPEDFRHGTPKDRNKNRLLAIYQDLQYIK